MDPELLDARWPLAGLFESLEDVQFWIKDRANRYLHANRALLLNYQLTDLEELRGRTDYDFSPAFLADQFWQDDEQVLKGERVVNRIELVGGAGESPHWSLTNKIPLLDREGRVVGTSGTTRRMGSGGAEARLGGGSGFERVLAYIRDRYHQPITNEELAGVASLSQRAFERRFKLVFHATPQGYLRKLRVSMACRALVFTERSLAEVAVECGFADQSHLNHEFRRQLGRTPGEYRAHYRR